MSAFCDIWIGSNQTKARPNYYRQDNLKWTAKNIPGVSCWQSMPAGKSFDYLQEASNATHHMIVLGQFYEPIDMSKLLQECGSYVDGTSKKFNDPAGHYLIFVADLRDGSSYIFTNRLGTYHIYHSIEAGGNALSTYYLGLAKETQSKQLDWEGITGFLGMGFFQDNTTYLKNIKILLPACCYKFDRQLNLIGHNRYWNWHYDAQQRATKEYTAQLHNLMTSSINYATSGKRVALPISGGLDSRTLAGMMTASGSDAANSIWGFSYGYTPASVETRIACNIAASRHITFNSYTLPNYLFDKMDAIKDAVEMFQYIDGTRQASMKEILEEKSELVIGGHWGDVWLDDMGIGNSSTASRADDLQAAFGKKIVKKGSDWLLKNVSGLHFANGRHYLNDFFQNFADQYRHIEDADFVMKIFKTDQWSFRWTLASIRMYQAAVFPVLPFYDKRVVDLFLQIPTSVVAGRQLQIDYLKEYHTDLAKITWQEYGNNLYWYKHFNNRNIAYRVVDKLRRTVKGEQPISRNWEVFYLNDRGRSQLENVLLRPPFTDVVPESICRQLLDNLYKNPGAGNGYAISMLHTFARFIETIA